MPLGATLQKTKQVNTGSMQREAEMLLACLLGRRAGTRDWDGVNEVAGAGGGNALQLGEGLSQAP